MTLLEKARAWTQEHWDEDDGFKKAWDAAELEVETAAKKGRHGTQLLYGEEARAQAIAAKFRSEGFQVRLTPGKAGKDFSNYFVIVTWGQAP
jgi:hypothetical protein